MHKRDYRSEREERRRLDEERRKRTITRNWIIMLAALVLAVLAFGFNDFITGFFQK